MRVSCLYVAMNESSELHELHLNLCTVYVVCHSNVQCTQERPQNMSADFICVSKSQQLCRLVGLLNTIFCSHVVDHCKSGFVITATVGMHGCMENISIVTANYIAALY